MKNVVENIQDTSNKDEPNEEIETFKRDNIVGSSICDGLTLKDMSASIKSSCIGRKVRIGRNVQIVNSVIMNKVVIGDDVKIVNSLICSGCKIGNGQVLKDENLGFKTNLADLKEDAPASEVMTKRRSSLIKTE